MKPHAPARFYVMDDPVQDPARNPFKKAQTPIWPPCLEFNVFKQTPVAQPKPIIENLLDSGSRILFGGGSKTFKTWMQCDLALSIASGQPWLGFSTQQARVLYVNFELKDYHMKKRLSDIAQARGIKLARDFLHVWNLRNFEDFGRDAFAEQLLLMCRNLGIVIVFIDPFYKLLADDEDENSQRDMRKALHCLAALNQAEIAISLGMHFSKGNQAGKDPEDRISGAGTLVRNADSVITLTKHEQPLAFILDFIIRDYPPVEQFVVKWQPPLMVTTGLDPKAIKRPLPGRPASSLGADLLALLAEHDDQLNPEEFQKLARSQLGFAKTTFYRRLNELKTTRQIFISKLSGHVNLKAVP